MQADFQRKVLREEEALAIYAAKLTNDAGIFGKKLRAEDLSPKFGVSTKTIRDIWACRTWAEETIKIDPSRGKCLNALKPPKRRNKMRGVTSNIHKVCHIHQMTNSGHSFPIQHFIRLYEVVFLRKPV